MWVTLGSLWVAAAWLVGFLCSAMWSACEVRSRLIQTSDGKLWANVKRRFHSHPFQRGPLHLLVPPAEHPQWAEGGSEDNPSVPALSSTFITLSLRLPVFFLFCFKAIVPLFSTKSRTHRELANDLYPFSAFYVGINCCNDATDTRKSFVSLLPPQWKKCVCVCVCGGWGGKG